MQRSLALTLISKYQGLCWGRLNWGVCGSAPQRLQSYIVSVLDRIIQRERTSNGLQNNATVKRREGLPLELIHKSQELYMSYFLAARSPCQGHSAT